MADERQDEDYIEIKIPGREAAPEKVTVEEEAQGPTREEKAAEPQPKAEAPAKKVAKKKKTARKKVAKKKTAKKSAAAKPSTTKKAKPKRSKQQPSGNANWLWIALLVIGLAVIATVIYLSLHQQAPGDQLEGAEQGQVAALVNGQPIYQEDLDQIYASLPPNLANVNESVILDQLIEQELLVQEAKKQGFTVTDAELQDYIDQLLAYYGMPADQLDAALEQQGVTRAEFEQSSKRQLLVSKLVNKTVYANINISDEQVAAQYEQNPSLYTVPASAVVRHILITPMNNETDNETHARAEKVMGLIDEDFGNFCDLVKNFTADTGSAQTCGEYEVMQNGQYVPEFEDAAFSMDVGDVEIVKSQFGYHIIWKTAQKDGGLLPLENVSESIRASLKQQEASTALAKYVATLRDQAVIEKYPVISDNEGEPLDVSGKTDEEVQVEKTQPVREGDFGACLADQGAVIYGTSWAPDVKEQRDMLGAAKDVIPYVDCDPASGEAPAECDNITVYPTWVIGEGQDALVLEGLQSLNALSRDTGCQA